MCLGPPSSYGSAPSHAPLSPVRFLLYLACFAFVWMALFQAYLAPGPPRAHQAFHVSADWGSPPSVGAPAPPQMSWIPDQPRWVSSFLDKHFFYPRSFEWVEGALAGTGAFLQTLGSTALRQLAADLLLFR